jgi:ATP-dependent Clp protease ATP-binding subunit ClpC
MFERYTENARRVIFFARYEASQFGSPYIETEHILLGLLREDKALTRRFLRGQEKVDSMRKQIEEATVVREKVSTSVDLPLSHECKQVLIYAAEESERLAHQHIGTEHLLLGLLRQERSFAAQLLNEQGVRLSRVREELVQATVMAEPAKEAKEFVLLSGFSTYLTKLAREEKLLPLIGREDKLEEITHVLARSSKNNVILVGEPGVGKRTIMGGLVQRVADGMAPTFLEGKLFVGIDLAMVVSGAQRSKEPAQFLSAITTELTNDGGNTIFVLDELCALLAGEAGGAHDITMTLKSAILDGKVRCIASATPREYGAAMKQARWLERCFLPVEVPPATEAEAIRTLEGVKDRFAKFHSVQYADEALTAAVVCSSRCIRDRHLPEKAIDLLDDAGAYVRMKLERMALPEEVIEARKKIRFIARRHQMAIDSHEFEKARFYRDEEQKQRDALRVLEQKYNIRQEHVGTVTASHIEEVLARWTGMPVALIRQKCSSPEVAGPEQRPKRPARKKRPKKKKSP